MQGNREEYYLPHNSLLGEVLKTGKGLPITLAVLFMSIGRAAGLPIMPVNMPRHFLLRMGEEGAPDELFIDAFDGGRLMSRCRFMLRVAT